MRLLAIDIGTGTQDILLLDTSLAIENCPKMVMPSPTVIVARQIQRATEEGRGLLLTGVTMGGGPNGGAARRHIRTGYKVYATPEAARTFDDDLAEVEGMGVVIVAPEEAARLRGVERIELRDLDLEVVRGAFAAFGLNPQFDGVAVAVLDHGAAPPGESDRIFRFRYLRRVVEERNELLAFAYLAQEVPPYLTRMKAVAEGVGEDIPLLLMDTGVAAALGALESSQTRSHENRLIVNLGNAHTLAFHLNGTSIKGLFEHHTGRLSTERVDSLLQQLVQGTLTNQEVFDEGGHGALVLQGGAEMPFLVATGPRRGLMAASTLNPYFAAPHGDMMLTGCFGLAWAFGQRVEGWREEIEKALSR